MKRITLSSIKSFIVHFLIGNYFTEKEVKEILKKMQYDMAQEVINNSNKSIVPLDYWMKNNNKYNTNFYK